MAGMGFAFLWLLLHAVIVSGKPVKEGFDTSLRHFTNCSGQASECGSVAVDTFKSDIHERKDTTPITSGDDYRIKRQGVTNTKSLWPSGNIPYVFEDGFPWKQEVLEAMKVWEDATCITFRENANDHMEPVVLKFAQGHGCSSTIGRSNNGDLQVTYFDDSCHRVGAALHELGHVIGFYHEQSRPDRDNHVIIHPENIKHGYMWDFQKYEASQVRTDEPYDIGSVMQYGSAEFSQNGNTIDPVDPRLLSWMGQRQRLSFIDIKTANKLYKCSDNCTSGLVCQNGGYVGPHCSCVCPPGLAGRSCDQIAGETRSTLKHDKDCGGVLRQSWGNITSPGYPAKYGDNVTCNWMIKGRPGRNITLVFHKFVLEHDDGSKGPYVCPYDSLEVRIYGPTLPGPKFCNDHPNEITYSGSTLVLRFTSDGDIGYTGFVIGYRTV